MWKTKFAYLMDKKTMDMTFLYDWKYRPLVDYRHLNFTTKMLFKLNQNIYVWLFCKIYSVNSKGVEKWKYHKSIKYENQNNNKIILKHCTCINVFNIN